MIPAVDYVPAIRTSALEKTPDVIYDSTCVDLGAKETGFLPYWALSERLLLFLIFGILALPLGRVPAFDSLRNLLSSAALIPIVSSSLRHIT